MSVAVAGAAAGSVAGAGAAKSLCARRGRGVLTWFAVDAQTFFEEWLAGLTAEQLTRLLEERELPLAAPYVRFRSLRQLAEHLLSDDSVARGLSGVTAGEARLLGALASRALAEHGLVAEPERTAHGRRTAPTVAVEPFDRLLDEAGVLAWLERGGVGCELAAEVFARLREQALLLPSPAGVLALPPLLHTRAAEFGGYGRPLERLLVAAFNAPEVKRIAATLGAGEPRTRAEAQAHVMDRLGDAAAVRKMVAGAPGATHDLLEYLVPGPPLLRTHCFVSRYGGYAGPSDTYTFREGGSGDEGTDWLAARGMLVPVGEDLAELPYEVARALRGPHEEPPPSLQAPALSRTVLPDRWAGEGGIAAAAAAWRAELVLRALAAQPVAVRKAGGIAVRETRRLAKAAGASEEDTRLWLDLAVTAGLAAPQADEPPATPRSRRGRGRGTQPKPSAQLLPSDRYDAWAAAPAAGKLLPLIAAWAVVPEVYTHWPDPDETPVALISPQDPYAVPLRRGVLRALASLPAGYGLAQGPDAQRELAEAAAWYQPSLRALIPADLDLPAADDDTETVIEFDGEGALEGALGDALEGALEDAAEILGLTGSPSIDDLGELLAAGGSDRLPTRTAADDLNRRLAATLSEAQLLGLVAHGALTEAGHAVSALLEAGAGHHFPAVPGTDADPAAHGTDRLGAGLDARPTLAAAVAELRRALAATLPEPSVTARFQADLTATVTGAPEPRLADLLSTVGDIESEGHAVVWRISPASLRRAYDAGWSAEELLAGLTAACEPGTTLPQPLAYTITDTARGHGRLRVVRSACCIRSDDTNLIAEVAHARGTAKLRLRRIAPTVLISTAPADETLAALRAAGYAPALEAETGTTVLQRLPSQRAPSRLPTPDEAHPPLGEPARGVPSSARTLATALLAHR